MEILNLILITLVLVIFAFGALSVRLFFGKDRKFSGGSCRNTPELDSRGIECGCGSRQPCGSNDAGQT